MKYFTEYDSLIGKISIISDGENLTGLYLEKSKNLPKDKLIEKELEIFVKVKKYLDLYFAGNIPKMDFKIKYDLSSFRKEVYEILLEIAYGKTMTYGQIAEIIAKKRNIRKMSAQAVGGAIAKNPIAIIIPCHRVIKKDNNIGGYAYGIEKKLKLLELERVEIEKIIV